MKLTHLHVMQKLSIREFYNFTLFYFYFWQSVNNFFCILFHVCCFEIYLRMAKTTETCSRCRMHSVLNVLLNLTINTAFERPLLLLLLLLLSRPTLWPTQPPIQSVPGLSRGKSCQGVALTTHPT